jgi:hypothetical protein
MTESEAEALLASASGRLCVQFYRRADGTVLTQDCPVGLAAVKRKMFGYAGAAAAFIFACLLLPLQPASERRHRIVVYREVKTKLVHPRPILEPAEVMIGGEANYGYDPAGTNFYVHPDGAASALGSPGHRDGRFVVIPGQTSVEISP